MAKRVYFGKGDQAISTVPVRDGRPQRVASATYHIYDTRYGSADAKYNLVPAGTAAQLDTVDTMLTSKAGANARAEDHRVITVVSTASILPGHRYLLTAPDGKAEEVRIAAVPSATGLLTVDTINGQYPTGSTLRGVEVTAVFPASAADDSKNLDNEPWIIIWTFPGFTPIRESIHLERGEEAQLATLTDLAELDQNIPNLGGKGVDPAVALSRAHKTFRTDLMLNLATESDLITGPVGVEAVVNLAAHYCYRHMDSDVDQKNADAYKERYSEIVASLRTGALKPQVVNLDKVSETADKRNPAKFFVSNGFGY